MMEKETLIKKLQKTFPGIEGIHDGDDWGNPGSIHLGDCAEGGQIDGDNACDYNSWECDPNEETWIMGVHKKLKKVVEDAGWWVECYDPGTYFAYPQ